MREREGGGRESSCRISALGCRPWRMEERKRERDGAGRVTLVEEGEDGRRGKRIESSGLISKQGKQYGEMLMRLYYG